MAWPGTIERTSISPQELSRTIGAYGTDAYTFEFK